MLLRIIVEDMHFYSLRGGIHSRIKATSWTEELGLFLAAAKIYLFYLHGNFCARQKINKQYT
jgi:hypothetical protein